MDKIAKIFKVNNEIISYTYPVIKIVLCLLLFMLLINRNRIFPFWGKRQSIIVTILSFVIAVACVFCIYISIVEIVELHYRRVDNQRNVVEIVTKQYQVEGILKLIEENDILELEIKFQNDIIRMGCTSDNEWSTNIFFDKVYYCNDIEYETIETFKEAINAYTIGEMLEVISIDGIKQ